MYAQDQQQNLHQAYKAAADMEPMAGVPVPSPHAAGLPPVSKLQYQLREAGDIAEEAMHRIAKMTIKIAQMQPGDEETARLLTELREYYQCIAKATMHQTIRWYG